MIQALSPLPRRLLTAFGLGHLRPAPGTWGSLPPLVLAAALLLLGVPGQSLAFGLVFAILAGAAAGVCVRYGDEAAAQFGRKDASEVVADEVAGMSLVFAFLPPGSTATPLLAAFTLVLAFLAFRAMDIFKPFPAYQLQSVPSGWGVLLDDLAAGLYAVVALHLAALVLPA